MNYQGDKFQQFVKLMDKYSPEEEVNLVGTENFGTIKSSIAKSKSCTVDQPVILIVGQGRKTYFLGDQEYDFSAGSVLV